MTTTTTPLSTSPPSPARRRRARVPAAVLAAGGVGTGLSGAALWFLGEVTAAGMHTGTLSFTASPGTYQYLCPVPGHTQEGRPAPSSSRRRAERTVARTDASRGRGGPARPAGDRRGACQGYPARRPTKAAVRRVHHIERGRAHAAEAARRRRRRHARWAWLGPRGRTAAGRRRSPRHRAPGARHGEHLGHRRRRRLRHDRLAPRQRQWAGRPGARPCPIVADRCRCSQRRPSEPGETRLERDEQHLPLSRHEQDADGDEEQAATYLDAPAVSTQPAERRPYPGESGGEGEEREPERADGEGARRPQPRCSPRCVIVNRAGPPDPRRWNPRLDSDPVSSSRIADRRAGRRVVWR